MAKGCQQYQRTVIKTRGDLHITLLCDQPHTIFWPSLIATSMPDLHPALAAMVFTDCKIRCQIFSIKLVCVICQANLLFHDATLLAATQQL